MITATQAFVIRELRESGMLTNKIAISMNLPYNSVMGVVKGINNGVHRTRHRYYTDGKRKICMHCGVRVCRRTKPRMRNTVLQWLVDGEWTHLRPGCNRKQLALTAI